MKKEKLQTSANQNNFDGLSYFVVNELPGSKRENRSKLGNKNLT